MTILNSISFTEGAAVAALVEGDAREFGLHLKEGGWRMGLLVARSVEPGEGAGAHLSSRERAGKVSMGEFARLALGGDGARNRVRRYYEAWERAADKGKVPHAADLEPGQEPDIDWPRLPPWKSFFTPGFSDAGATGPLNLTIRLGNYGDKLLRSHRSLVHFLVKDLPEHKPGKRVRDLAGEYAAAHEAEARMLRRIEAGDVPSVDEVKQELEPTKFFRSA